jgi:hypothetical protein
MKDVFHAKTKLIDITVGEELSVLLNEREARKHGINSMDKISLLYHDQEIVLDVELSTRLVNP